MGDGIAARMGVAHTTLGFAADSMNEKQAELEQAIKAMSWSEFSEFLSILNDDEKARAMQLRRELTSCAEDKYGRN